MKVRFAIEVEVEVNPDDGYPMPKPGDAVNAFIDFKGENLIDHKALHESGYIMPDGKRFRGFLTAKIVSANPFIG